MCCSGKIGMMKMGSKISLFLAGFLFFNWFLPHPSEGIVYAHFRADEAIDIIPTQTPVPLQEKEDRKCLVSCKKNADRDMRVELCILDNFFVLGNPISAEDNQFPDATYRYGSTQGGKRQIHHGVDIKNKLGTLVFAAEDGIVIAAGKDDERAYGPHTDFYGQLVILRHDLSTLSNPLYTLYGHLQQVSVKVGQRIKRGQPIGSVGMGGVAIGIHLHFEVRYGKNTYGNTRNPELWMVPPKLQDGEISGAFAGRIIDREGQPIQVKQVVLKQNDAAEDDLPIYLNSYEIFPDPSHGGATNSLPQGTDETRIIGRDDFLQEDFAINGLKPGIYTLSFTLNKVYKQQVEILPGKLTFITITLDS